MTIWSSLKAHSDETKSAAAVTTRRRGKYHCTSDLQFVWFGRSSFSPSKYQQILMLCQIQSSQTGDQTYSDIFPYSECSMVAFLHHRKIERFQSLGEHIPLRINRHNVSCPIESYARLAKQNVNIYICMQQILFVE